MQFQFRLQSVLAHRQRERDVKQQSVIEARTRLAKLFAERDRLLDARASVTGELRIMNAETRWRVDQVIHHQRHADHLGTELALAEDAIIQGQSDLEACLTKLIVAIQSVRALEKLATRRFAAHQEAEAKSAARG